ncbi:M48 family peptidase [Sphingobacteriales bacterium UPWRP_1]|nr:peptidase M48 [Sphingobacteriales bacterium TSM_CSS]PSJ75473.1 M48 family peptidase [Sphingobacteriales bacterium UPWRP_1]
MNKQIRQILLAGLLIAVVAAACSKVPLTGRKQFTLIPDATLNQLSNDQYRDFLSQNKVVSGTPDAQMVKNIGQRISQSVQQYLAQNKAADRVQGFKWEFNLIDSKEVNAWCMPGGKVAVYTGLLPVTKNENALAVVMGHEIAHAIAEHGSERMTQGLLQQLGAVGLALAMQNKPAQTRDMFMQAYGIGSTVGVMLPFSRKQETEADELGLVFAAMAGYDPKEAVAFWQRMSQAGGAKPPEFLSTHPSDATRINNLQKFMPTALKYYKPGSNTGGATQTTTDGKQPAGKPTGTNTNKNAQPQRIKTEKKEKTPK